VLHISCSNTQVYAVVLTIVSVVCSIYKPFLCRSIRSLVVAGSSVI